MLKWISEKLFPGDGDGSTQPSKLTAEVGAAGLCIEAAYRDGAYTDVERDIAAKAIMRLFRIDHASAVALRRQAEAAQARSTTMMGFASSAARLSPDDKECLIRQLWKITDSDGSTNTPENVLISSVADVFGMDPARAKALREVTPESDGKDAG